MTVVEFTGTTLVAAVPPIVTPVAPVRFVPVIVTLVPPAIGPLLGLRLVTVGALAYVYSEFAAFVPPAVVTRTLAVPALPAGMVAVIVVEFTGTTLVAAVPPIVTPVAPVRFVPVIVTLVPPAVGPLPGLRLVTVGALAYVYSVFAAFVPPAVVTRTLAVPAVPAGVVAVIDVALTTVKLVAALPPIVTPVAPMNPVPVIVTAWLPATGPAAGLIDVTAAFTAKVCSTCAAARFALSPAWSAWIVQFPALTNASKPPVVIVQTPGVAELNATVSVAVAVSVGVVPNTCGPGLLNVIVCGAFGVTEFEAADAAPVPTLFVAVTVNV